MKAGFALLEILIAATVFFLVAFALVQALDATLDVARDRWLIDHAVLGLKNQLALLHNARLVPSDQQTTEETSGILYQTTIEPVSLANEKKQPLAGLYRVTLRAAWKQDGQPAERTVTELFYQP